MANNLACYNPAGCPEQFPNGAEGQVIQIVGGIPTWVDATTIGSVSSVTINSPALGQYQHNDGQGNLVTIDTNADTAVFDPAATELTAVTAQGAIDQLATYSEGWRIIGGAGTGANATEPVRASNLLVTDDKQTIGGLMVGGGVGDTLSFFAGTSILHVKGNSLVEGNTAVAMDFVRIGGGVDEKYWKSQVLGSIPVNNTDYYRITPRTDANAFLNTSFEASREGNISNNNAIGFFDQMGAEHVQFFLDGGGVSATVAPAAPPTGVMTSHWSIGGEHFVMDGAGNVTQLSSHPDVAFDLLPPPASHPTARYNFDYNIFSGVGSIALNAGIQSASLVFDIDSGDYTRYDVEGTEVETGTDSRLAECGKCHPLPVNQQRGSEYWEYMQNQYEKVTEENQLRWDSASEEERKELGDRPLNYEKRLPPKAIENQFVNKKRKRKKS